MPSCPRGAIVFDGEVGVYHCWARCVRRAQLCGVDPATGKDFEYRRSWIVELHQYLASLFAIEVAFHAEMSNHLHVVLRSRPDVADTWSDEEVVRRWLKIAKVKRGSVDFLWEPSEKQIRRHLAQPGRVARLRRRLSKVSWFMGTLCENISRRANAEDGVKGTFWESRYFSRNLIDEAAILVCGIYVDLNQIRAGEATTPEASRFTSAFARIESRRMRENFSGKGVRHDENILLPDRWLCELSLQEGLNVDVRCLARTTSPWRASDKGILPLSLDQYLQLLDWTGRQLRSDKPGAIPSHLAPILERLQIRVDCWTKTITHFDTLFKSIVGCAEHISSLAQKTGNRWRLAKQAASEAFTASAG